MIECLLEENAGKLDLLGYLVPIILFQTTPLPTLSVIKGKRYFKES